jgi:hypothetical protein
MTPGYTNRGAKRTMGSGGGVMGRLKQQMQVAPRDDPASRMQNSMMENDWITVPRKVAMNPDLSSQKSKLDQMMVFIRPADDDHTTVDGDTTRDGHFLALTNDGDTRTISRNMMSSSAYAPLGGGVNAYLTFEVSLSEMNHLLQAQETTIEDPEGLGQFGDRNFAEVMDEWAFGGIQVTSLKDDDKYGMPMYTGEDPHTTSVVWGMGFTANYWGKAARRGQRLYLLAKRVDRGGPYLPTKGSGDAPYRLGVLDPREVYGFSENDAQNQGLVAKPFQLVPWPSPEMVEPGDYPPYDDRLYIDNHGEERLAHVITIGISYEPRSKIVPGDLFDRVSWDDTAVNKLPRATIMLGA